jgi:CRISPR/Cas system-associated exonuclease Cas4 (RecB family)
MVDPIQQLYDSMDAAGWEEARHHRAPPRRFRASESSNCVRRVWHRHHGDRPAPRKAQSMMYGVCGDADHDITRQLLKHYGVPVMGVVFEKDGEVTEQLLVRKEFTRTNAQGQDVTVTLTARADGVIDTPRGRCVLEVKGMGYWPYDWLNKAFVAGGEAGAHKRLRDKHGAYYDQCQVTMALTGYKQAYLLPKDRATGTLGLHNAETGERAGLYIEFNEADFEAILQRFVFIASKVDEPPLPERPSGSYECNFCEYRYRCHDRFSTGEITYPGPQVEEYNDGTGVGAAEAGAGKREEGIVLRDDG